MTALKNTFYAPTRHSTASNVKAKKKTQQFFKVFIIIYIYSSFFIIGLLANQLRHTFNQQFIPCW